MENLTENNLSEVERLAFEKLDKIFADNPNSKSNDLLSLINQENSTNDKQKIHYLFVKYYKLKQKGA